MILGAFCAVACVVAPWHAAVQPGGAITMNGVKIGVYVDDQVPDQAAVVAADVARGEAVVAGVALCCPSEHFPGALSALEWYPFSHGRAWTRVQPPSAQAYIVQGRFRWPGDPMGATTAEQRRLWLRATASLPVMVLTYNGN
jgi:hypothetical protein